MKIFRRIQTLEGDDVGLFELRKYKDRYLWRYCGWDDKHHHLTLKIDVDILAVNIPFKESHLDGHN